MPAIIFARSAGGIAAASSICCCVGPGGGVSFAIRFHIHPDVRMSASQGGDILLKLPNGEGWRFRAQTSIATEESVYLGTETLRRTEQLVLSGAVKDTPVEIGWMFEQIGRE